MKRYYLTIHKGNVEVFVLDDSKKNFLKKLERLRNKYKTLQELTVDTETKGILDKHRNLKIKQDDIKYLLNGIKRKLATNDLPDNIKNTFLRTYKKNKKINPLFILLFKSNKTVVDILRMLDFPNKQIIIEILKSNKDNKQKYEDIKRIWEIEYMKEKMMKKIKSILTFAVIMFIAIVAIGLGFKFLLAPKLADFLSGIAKSLGILQGNQRLPIEVAANRFLVVVIAIIVIIGLFILLRVFSKRLFIALLLRLPIIGEIIRKQNTINVLMLYSFYSTNANEFYNRLKEMFSLLDLDFYWSDIPELIAKTYDASEKQLYGARIIDIDIVDTVENLSQIPNPDKQLKMEIDMYMDELDEYIQFIQNLMTKIITIIVGLAVGGLAGSLFLTMKEVPQKINEMKAAAGI